MNERAAADCTRSRCQAMATMRGSSSVMPQRRQVPGYDRARYRTARFAVPAADGTQILNTAVLSSRDVDGTPFTAEGGMALPSFSFSTGL